MYTERIPHEVVAAGFPGAVQAGGQGGQCIQREYPMKWRQQVSQGLSMRVDRGPKDPCGLQPK